MILQSRVETGKREDSMNLAAPPVFIIGIMPRSGTNFFSDVLQLIDARFQLPHTLQEDFLLENSNFLTEYVERTYERWKRIPWLEQPEQWKRLLSDQLGDALLRLLCDGIGPDKRLLAKTPNPSNVDKFFHLFPHAKLPLLVRDGRDVVESAFSTWSYEPYEYWIKQWVAGARSILDFTSGPARNSRGSSWELVKYEDLLGQPQQVVTQLAAFLEVDNSSVDWQQIASLPIRGSSQNRDAKGQVDWTPADNLAGFKPVGRWSTWTWRQKRQFKRLAGRELSEFGYAFDSRW
jgi:hypothetical protein